MTDELNLNLLRAYADGELPAEEAIRVEGQLAREPHWHNWLEAERRLRDRVDHTMRVAAAPAELRERIVAELATEVHRESAADPIMTETAAPAAANRDDRAVDAERPGLLAALIALFSRQHHMRVSAPAVALTVIFVMAVVLFGIFGPQVDRPGGQPLWQPNALLAAAAEHVSREHDRCAGNEEALLSKLVAMTDADAAVCLQSHLGVESVTVFDLSELGYRFVGVGYCSMPGVDRSAHLMYRRNVPGEPKSMMSIFVVPNDGLYPAKCSEDVRKEGRWSGVCGGQGCTKTILHGSDDQLVYFLACGYPEQVKQVSHAICKTLARRGR